MRIQELLGGMDCACGRHHTCPIRFVAIEPDAIRHLAKLAEPYASVLLVADENTWGAAGEKAEAALAGRDVRRCVFPGAPLLVPDERAVETVTQALGDAELIVAVGSGVIQDLCKYVSFRQGVPYLVAATAPSMDGYASSGAAMILKGMKTTVTAAPPVAILADTEVLRHAPMDMIRAGFGDILGKYSSLNDWKLSSLVTGEYFCQTIYDLTYEMLQRTLALAEGLQRREEESIRALTEALVGVGIAISFAGSSRPASGSEHHLSHFFEMTGLLNREPYFPHGIDVGYAAVLTARMREELLRARWPERTVRTDRARYVQSMRRLYGPAADGYIALQDEAGNYTQDRMDVYRGKERQIRAVLAECPRAAELERILDGIGLPRRRLGEMYSNARVTDALVYAKDVRVRYSVLWLYYDLFGERPLGFFFAHDMLVAGHRGSPDTCFENTMESFEAAYRAGVEMVETDVRMTADGALILLHDATFWRTGGDARAAAQMTLAEVQTVNVGSERDPRAVPTLEELLSWAQEKDLLLNLELKEYHESGNEERCRVCAERAVELVRKYGMESRVVFNSFDAWPLEYIDDTCGHAFLLHGFYPYSAMKHVGRSPDTYLFCACIWGSNVRKDSYDALAARGIEPWVGAGVTSEMMLEQACRYGAKLVTSNSPAETAARLRRLGRRA